MARGTEVRRATDIGDRTCAAAWQACVEAACCTVPLDAKRDTAVAGFRAWARQ